MRRKSSVTLFRSLIIWLGVALTIAGPAQSASSRPNQQPAPDEAALRSAVSEYFESFAKKDLDRQLKYWESGSPERENHRKELQQEFAANDGIEVRNVVVRKLSISNDRATVQVALEITAKDVKTGRPSVAFGKLMRAMLWVKTAGTWKILREVSATDELAVSLIAATTEAEQAALIADNRELLSPELVRALVAQGTRLRIQGKFPEALRIYQLALAQAERTGDTPGSAMVFRAIGSVKRMQGDYDPALEYYRKSLGISEAAGDKSATATALNSMAGVEYIRGEYARALNLYEQSLKVNEELKSNEGSSSVLNNMGLVYLDQGNYLKSLDCFQKSLALTDPSDNLGIVSTLLNIGDLYSALGNYPLALDHFQKTLFRAEQLGAKPVIWKALQSIGIVQRNQGNYAESLVYLQRALAVLNSIGSKDRIAGVVSEIGAVYEAQRDYPRALEFFQQSLDMARIVGIKAPGTLNHLARVLDAQGNHQKALESAEEAAATAREINQNEVLWQSRTTAGQAYLGLQKPEQAREAFAEAIRIIESLREEVPGAETQREEFFENKLTPYTAIIGLLLGQNRAAEALSYAERAKARVLLDVLRSGRMNVNKSMTASERQREQELTAQLIALNTQIAREQGRDKPDPARLGGLTVQLDKARLEREDFQTSLYAAHPGLKTQRGEAEVLQLNQAGELLPDDKSALLEYVVAGDQIYLFVLTKRSQVTMPDLHAYQVPCPREALVASVEKFRQRLANRDLDYSDSATELYNLLIKPAQASLHGKSMLVIVPDDVLWDLPFQALQPAAGHYLVEDYAVSYAPSLTVLRAMIMRQHRQMDAAMPTLLAVGNPSLGNRTRERARIVSNAAFPPLPEAERQVKVLGQLYGPQRSRIYVGAEAREDRLKAEAQNYRILHLATHGVLNNANPMYSNIVLAQSAEDSKEDGLLEGWEIMDLDLKADLVVLSACDTARGRIGSGEGVIGLTWAFFVAGTPTTVVSQWRVESASTTDLMLSFHRNLKSASGGAGYAMTRAEALRQAELKLLRTNGYQHPFFWAGFVVMGDGF
jgi:CHAT domain-containing protein